MKAFLFGVLACTVISCSHKITESGRASYYADKFQGRKTASGERFSQHKLTAAHKTLPFGTMVKVVNLANGRSVKVEINDRGPFVGGRIIDLSKKAARKIGMVGSGVANVEIRYKKKR
jgi:rare lipoprotein A